MLNVNVSCILKSHRRTFINVSWYLLLSISFETAFPSREFRKTATEDYYSIFLISSYSPFQLFFLLTQQIPRSLNSSFKLCCILFLLLSLSQFTHLSETLDGNSSSFWSWNPRNFSNSKFSLSIPRNCQQFQSLLDGLLETSLDCFTLPSQTQQHWVG